MSLCIVISGPLNTEGLRKEEEGVGRQREEGGRKAGRREREEGGGRRKGGRGGRQEGGRKREGEGEGDMVRVKSKRGVHDGGKKIKQ